MKDDSHELVHISKNDLRAYKLNTRVLLNILEGQTSEDIKIIKDAVYRSYDFLFALGYFTSPTNEGRIVENLLIQARVRVLEIEQHINRINNKL